MRHSSLVSVRFCVLTSLGLLQACGGRGSGSGGVDRVHSTDERPAPIDDDDDNPATDRTEPPTEDITNQTEEPRTEDITDQTEEPQTEDITNQTEEPRTDGPSPESVCSPPERPVGEGLFECSNGAVHRVSTPTCETELPRPDRIVLPDVITAMSAELPIPSIDAGPPASGTDGAPIELGTLFPIVYYDESSGITYNYRCLEDADCNERAFGMCIPYRDEFEYRSEVAHSGDHTGSYCTYRCANDADCNEGFVCECSPLAGTCLPANCATDDDCDDEQACARYSYDEGCGRRNGYACTTPLDECYSNSDCDYECMFLSGHRRCEVQGCDIGRPFLVNGEIRTASLVARSDWNATPNPLPRSEDAALTREERRMIAAEWQRIGLMEHASIAAFARFTLELLSLGAPPALVEAAQRAMADETRHAKLAFALAQRFGGESFGPGPLDLGGALTVGELKRAVLDTVLEGCIGETTAALEARLALENTECPEVRAVLETIARDEQRHAELAWRFVDWALKQHPELVDEVSALVGALLAAPSHLLAAPSHLLAASLPTHTVRDAGAQQAAPLRAYGILSAQERLVLRKQVLAEVVRPCMTVLCARARAVGAQQAAPLHDGDDVRSS